MPFARVKETGFYIDHLVKPGELVEYAEGAVLPTWLEPEVSEPVKPVAKAAVKPKSKDDGDDIAG